MDRKSLIKLSLMLPLLVQMSACGTQQMQLPVASQPVKAAAIPALLPQARQLPAPS
jgi:hypothetical protein